MPRSHISSDCQSAASGPPEGGAWLSCGIFSKLPEVSIGLTHASPRKNVARPFIWLAANMLHMGDGSEASVITNPSLGGKRDRIRPHIGYAAFCEAVPGCGWSAAAGILRESLSKVADVVDIWGAPSSRGAVCDAILVMDCIRPVPEPYFLYLCSEHGDVVATDRSMYERAAGLFTANGRLARALAEDAGIPPEKIHVIPPALAVCQSSSCIQPPHLRAVPRRKLLLCVSDRGRKSVNLKSVQLVFDALDTLRREHDLRVRLTVSGLENWKAVGSPPEGVTFRGASVFEETMAFFDGHDLLVAPPSFDSCGLPQALSRGLPCVAARASAMSDAITSGVNGAVIEDWDPRELARAIASVLVNEVIYRTCFERAPAMAAYFSWERVARQVTRVISREVGLMVLGRGDLRHAWRWKWSTGTSSVTSYRIFSAAGSRPCRTPFWKIVQTMDRRVGDAGSPAAAAKRVGSELAVTRLHLGHVSIRGCGCSYQT